MPEKIWEKRKQVQEKFKELGILAPASIRDYEFKKNGKIYFYNHQFYSEKLLAHYTQNGNSKMAAALSDWIWYAALHRLDNPGKIFGYEVCYEGDKDRFQLKRNEKRKACVHNEETLIELLALVSEKGYAEQIKKIRFQLKFNFEAALKEKTKLIEKIEEDSKYSQMAVEQDLKERVKKIIFADE